MTIENIINIVVDFGMAVMLVKFVVEDVKMRRGQWIQNKSKNT